MAQEAQDAAMAVCTSKPHFFRPLLPGFEHRLSIPVAFFKFFNDGEMVRETSAVLRSPGGKSYQVRISGGREFRDAGWKAFVEDHSLHVGDFLVFRYDARMVFDVMIFDPSACERVYPSSPSSSLSLPFVAPVKAEHETSPADKEQHETELHCRTTDGNGDEGQAAPMEKAAAGFVPKGPSFVVTIGRNNLKKNRLLIPREFAKKNDLESMTHRLAMVLNEEGRPWPAHLIINNRLAYPNYRPQLVLGRGINQFLEDNGLKLGDTFCLELVRGGEGPVFRMSGLHENPEAIKNERREKIKLGKVKKEPIPSGSGSSTIKQNYFNIKLTSGYFDGYALYIPMEFAEENGLTGLTCLMILQNEKGTPYLVNLKSDKAGRSYIGGGWIELVKANGLRMGHILRFELVETGMNPVMTFKVVSQEEICDQGKSS